MVGPRKRLVSLALLIAAAVYTSCALFYVLNELRQIAEPYVFALLAALTAITALYAFWRAVSVQKDIKRVTVGESYPIICDRVEKRVTILNAQGDAEINLHYTCTNTSNDALQQFVLNYYFDGELQNLQLRVNDSPAIAQVEEFVTRSRKGESPRFPLSWPNLLKVKYDLRDTHTRPGDNITCNITMKLKKCYEKLVEQEFSSFYIYMPTKSLIFSLKAPKGLTFVKESLGFSVVNRHEILDSREKVRIEDRCAPEVDEKGETIVWDLPAPKLAVNYVLYFRLRREP